LIDSIPNTSKMFQTNLKKMGIRCTLKINELNKKIADINMDATANTLNLHMLIGLIEAHRIPRCDYTILSMEDGVYDMWVKYNKKITKVKIPINVIEMDSYTESVDVVERTLNNAHAFT
jgi:hypothetical protein